MAKFIVEQSGPLRGEVDVSGSKNAVLPILAATLMAEGKCEIYDVPNLRDVDVMCRILRSMGASVEEDWETHTITTEIGSVLADEVPYELVKRMRASIFAMGPLLARTGKARIALPGGCSIGDRPIDLHNKGMRSLGARVTTDLGMVEVEAEKLQGSLIYLDFPSVGATENIMMAATMAEGLTTHRKRSGGAGDRRSGQLPQQDGSAHQGGRNDTIRSKEWRSSCGARHTVIPIASKPARLWLRSYYAGDCRYATACPDHVKPSSPN